VTWNCNGALRKKCTYLKDFDADLYIIQECENPAVVLSKDPDYLSFSANNLWIGKNKNKGLGIFAKRNHSIEKLSWNTRFRGRELQWFLPAKIDGKFNVVAVWNHHADATAFKYIGQFWLFLQNNKHLLKEAVICGDFNSNAIWDSWDRWWNHSDCVRELSDLNIQSVYHEINKIEQGFETVKTFYLQRNENKGYHIDYFFADMNFFKRDNFDVHYGIFSEWKDKSDHVPVILEF
jgi:endonuclease/exonuclease/phosphatase family metal-dependent hydrolase